MGFPAQSFFRRELDWAVGLDGFFVEWRAITDNPAWLIEEGQVPTVVSAAGRASSWYHITFSEANAAFFRDPVFPLVVADVAVSSPHTYRVEVFPDEYIWYVDGVVIDAGVPEGPYPDPDAFLIWGVEVTYDGAPTATTAWDYVRAGRIPDPGTGDFDGDTAATFVDYYYVAECLSREGPGLYGGPLVGSPGAGPGCQFTDFDGDSDVDLMDFAEVQNIFFGFECEPICRPEPFAPETGEPAEDAEGGK